MPYKDGGKSRHKWRYDNDPEYKERVLEKNREYRRKNKEQIVAHCREKRRREKQERVNLLGGCCVGCGQTDINVLQFDHLDRTKKVGPLMRMRKDQLLSELKNCQVLCNECHRIKTMVNQDNNPILKGYDLQSITREDNRITIVYEVH